MRAYAAHSIALLWTPWSYAVQLWAKCPLWTALWTASARRASEKQLDTMELCGVKAPVGAESAGSSQILPLSLAKPLTARPLLLANGRSAARGALRGH